MISSRQSRTIPDRWLSGLALLVWAINVALLVWQVWIESLPPSILDPSRLLAPSGDGIESLSIRQTSLWMACLLCATMAGLITSLRPRNLTGWCLAVLAFGFTVNVVGSVYARYALLRNPGALPAGELALWLAQWCAAPAQVALVFLLLLFPSGRLASKRWKPVLWVAALAVAFYAVERAFTPGSIDTAPMSLPSNPFTINGVPSILGRGSGGFLVYQATLILAVFGLVNRLRYARGKERQQLKWFVFGAAWLPLTAAGNVIITLASLDDGPLARDVIPIANYIVVLVILLAMTIGILQHRLFDIDVVINRTLVYGVVTALLAGTFAALSIVSQRLTLAITGQTSEVAVIAAALVVTALFQPLRARVQILVDHRFYRTKYDAGRTLERFAGRVRDEVELDHLTTSLVSVVQETMQPSHASLWLRPMRNAEDRS